MSGTNGGTLVVSATELRAVAASLETAIAQAQAALAQLTAWINALSPAPSFTAGTTIAAGPSQAIKTIAGAVVVAKDGDTIQMDAGQVYAEAGITIAANVLLDLGGSTLSAGNLSGSGISLASALAVVQNGTVTGYGAGLTANQGVAGILSVAPGDHELNGVTITGCQNGYVCYKTAAEPTIIDCTFSGNAITDVFASGNPTLTLDGTSCTSSGSGNAVLSRAQQTSIGGGAFAADHAAVIDIANGGTASISGAVLNKGTAATSGILIAVGTDAPLNPGPTSVLASSATIDAQCASPEVIVGTGTLTFDGTCVFQGNKIAASGAGTVVGLPSG